MANWYVYSGAVGTGAGTSWANAVTTLTAALALAGAVAGDTFYVANDHAETQASAMTITFKGTASAPDRVICVNRAGSVPPVSADLATTATVTTTGAFGITIGGAAQYFTVEGITFNAGTGATNAVLQIVGSYCKFKNCGLAQLGTTGAAGGIRFSPTAGATPGYCLLDNTTMKFGSTGASFMPGGDFVWRNTPSAIQGATIPTAFLNGGTSSSFVSARLDGVDLSALGSNKLMTGAGAAYKVQLVNCKLGTTGSLVTTAPTTPYANRIEIINSDSAATGYRQEVYAYEATLTTEGTIVRTGGASDGVKVISHKIVTTANAKASAPFESFQSAIWNTTTGSAKTLTVEIVNDGATLTSADIWMDVEYLGSALTPNSSLVSSGPADSLAAGVNISTSVATWTTTGLTTPIKQAMSVSFTPQMAGYVRVTVKVAKASATIYVDPKLTIT